MKKETIKKLDTISLIIFFLGLFGPFLVSFILGNPNRKVPPLSGICFIIMGLINTTFYIQYWREDYTRMDATEKIVWIKRFGFGLILILSGGILLGLFSE